MTEALVEKARGVAGRDSVREPAGADDRVDGVTPSVVIEPDSVEALAEFLAWASASRLSVVVRGGGTRDRLGRPPRPFDVLLRLHRLNRIVAHEAADLTATVEAGATLIDVNAALGAQAQRLPLDGLRARHGTIGGLLATNDIGPMRHRFGTPRDLVIGMTFVQGDGLRASAGGRVVKNVAGYDLARLMTGSFGTLGVIASATFKLAPMPPVWRTVRITLRRVSDAVALCDQVGKAHCDPEALDVAFLHGRDGTPDRIVVLAEFRSIPGAVEDACRKLLHCARDLDGQAESLSAEAARSAWEAQRAPADGVDQTILRVSWRPSDIDHAASALREAARDLPATLTGRLAIGSGTVSIGGPAADHAAVVTRLRAAPALQHVTIVDAPASVRAVIDPWHIDADTSRLWRALKDACDPHGTLGAGRGPV